MKKLVLSISIGDRDFAEYTRDSMSKYAERIGADFKFITDFKIPEQYQNILVGRAKNSSYLSKVIAIQQALKEYDRVIWVDDSCIISKDCPDLFNIVPYELMGAHNEGILDWVMACEYSNKFLKGQEHQFTKQNYINTGVMVVSKEHASVFSEENIIKYGNANFFANAYVDQTYINYLVLALKTPMFMLPTIFNRMLLNVSNWQGKKIVYEAYTPLESAIGLKIDDFSFLNEVNTKIGNINGAYIYHTTSTYKPDQRLNLIKNLYRVKVN